MAISCGSSAGRRLALWFTNKHKDNMLPEKAKKILDGADAKMKSALSFLEDELKTYRVGKANPSIFNGVTVAYYGTPMPISQIASISTPDAKTLAIQPWEKNMISKIEKAIMDANLGFTPSNNGEVIRCVVPPLTEDRRKDLIKKARATGENTKVTIRNARRDAVDQLKKAQKASEISEDAQKEGEDEVQKITDKNVKEVDKIIAAKEKEVMTV